MSLDFKMETDISRLSNAFEKLPRNVRKKTLRRTTRQGASVIRDDIKKTAPVRTPDGKKPRPGRLRRLIRVKPRRGGRTWLKVSLIYPRGTSRDDPKAAFYWRFLEFGTKKMQAKRYIFKSGRRNFKRVLGRMAKGVEDQVAKEIKTAAR